MNILGIGVDIIEINRIKKAIDRNPKFLERIFTDREIKYFKDTKFNSQTIAGNFASKEAISKAFGTGIRGFNFKDIEIIRNSLGEPLVNTYNNLNKTCINYNVIDIKITISHCKEYAVANAMIIIN